MALSRKAVSVQWIRDLKFLATNEGGQSIVIDATERDGRMLGVSPMELILMGLGACTGIDVVSILRKQRQELVGLEVNVSGERREEHPRYYERIHVEYVVKGRGLEEEKVARAIELSELKYCSVRAMLAEKAEITRSYRIEAA
ncbi:MAG: OsmC family protein [Candidatus Bathyarchaeia archaeon]